MANFPTNYSSGSIWFTDRNCYVFDGYGWKTISQNIAYDYTKGTASLTGSDGFAENTKVFGSFELTASAIVLDNTYNSGSHISIPVTGSTLKLVADGSSGESILRIESKYNNIMKHYKVNMSSSS